MLLAFKAVMKNEILEWLLIVIASLLHFCNFCCRTLFGYEGQTNTLKVVGSGGKYSQHIC